MYFLLMSNKYEKLIIFIWEWKTEISFITSLLKNKYWFKQNCKSNAFIEKWKTLVCLAHPQTWICHKWWDCTIYWEETYKRIRPLLLNTSKFVFNINNVNIEYIILTDIKEAEKKIKYSDEYIKNYLDIFDWNINILFASYEIETWFLVWIWNDFKKNYLIDDKGHKDFLKNRKIENIRDTKEILDKVLPKQISWKTMYIWEEFWRYIDVDLWISKSNSFKVFINKLNDII